jgi:hypothetical protein
MMTTEVSNLPDQLPGSALDVVFDWAPFFAGLPLDKIASFILTTPTGVTKLSESSTDFTVTAWYSSTTPGVVYRVSCEITSDLGRKDTMHADLRVPYLTPPTLYLEVTTADVRRVLGLDVGELPDEDISLQKAALLVRHEIGSTTFDNARAAQDHTTIWVNNLVTYRAALELAPSLPLRAAQSQSSDTAKFQRFKTDFPLLVEGLRAAYAENLLSLSAVDDTLVIPVLFTKSIPAPNVFPGA